MSSLIRRIQRQVTSATFQRGMTLRDWFAGQVLAGLLGGRKSSYDPSEYANLAYELADAMLAERAKGNET